MRRLDAYIHSLPDWPTFRFDDRALAGPVAAVRHKQGRLLGRMESLGFELRREAGMASLTSDVVKSSAIEGEKLDADEVRSSIARRLGMDAGGLRPAAREVDGMVDMLLDATRGFDRPLTKRRLFDWHSTLFPTGRSGLRRIAVGRWRTAETGPMQVVSGPVGREKVHFEAPSAERLDGEMSRFFAWSNAWSKARPTVDPVLAAGLAHVWFVTIHPFEDGNGRIARAIADLWLARGDGTPDRFYSMSTQIAAERKEYYRQLETAQRGDLDVTPWLSWFVACLDRAIDGADAMLATVLRKADLWKRVNRTPVNERQRLVLNRLLDAFEGFLSTSKYAKLAGCSTDTALRDIRELVDRGILVRNPASGRSTSYRLGETQDIDRG